MYCCHRVVRHNLAQWVRAGSSSSRRPVGRSNPAWSPLQPCLPGDTRETSAFLREDFSEGTCGHPWEQTLCAIGERLSSPWDRTFAEHVVCRPNARIANRRRLPENPQEGRRWCDRSCSCPHAHGGGFEADDLACHRATTVTRPRQLDRGG